MKTFLVTQKKGLCLLHTQPFGTAKIALKLAEKLIADHATGKTIRIGQLWLTKYEINVDGNLYVIKLRDSQQNTEIIDGSDL
jgi:hypothetical protein